MEGPQATGASFVILGRVAMFAGLSALFLDGIFAFRASNGTICSRRKSQMSYVDEVIAKVKAKNAAEPEFIQAVEEPDVRSRNIGRILCAAL